MPYVKRRYAKKRRHGTGEKKWRQYGASAGSVAYKGYNLAKKLARFVNVEYKYIPFNIAVGTTNAGIVYPLSLCAEGATDQTRTGLSIKPMRISGRIQLTTAGAFTNTVRLMVFKWKQENGVTPAIADLLDTGANVWLASKNHLNRFQSKVVYDRLITLSATGAQTKVLDMNIKCYGHTNYNAAGGAIGQLDDGGYYLFVNTDAVANFPTIYGCLKLTFVDN